MQNPRFYSLFLHRLNGIGAANFNRLVELFGSPEAVITQNPVDLQPLVSQEALADVLQFQRAGNSSALAQRVLADMDWLDAQLDVRLLELNDPAYPNLLRQVPKPPPLLFVRGDVHNLSLPQIAIVGSRNPSSGGRDNALRFGDFLAANGFVITSGLALGVDAAAHEGALRTKGKTIAVMGTGIDIIYPARHRSLARQILDTGGTLVSELPLGTGSNASNFPQRNRIISGMSYGVLVVEAAIQSGSLITASLAMQQNREVFAIPGSIHNPLARGCHQLIRQGATLVETAQHIVEQLAGMLSLERETLNRLQEKAAKKARLDQASLEGLSPAEQQAIQHMGYDPVNMDDLAERTGMAIGSLAALLVGLEIKGYVEQAGAAYQRV